ncbi:MAG: glycerol kinase GlpK [bacterium]
MKYILALDQGTTSSRAVLFDARAAVAAMAQREFSQIYPRPGWVEHDPMEIWSTQLAAAREALERADAAPRDVAAIGITNQRETAVMWDRDTGAPVCNAIVWQDRRTAPACDRLRADGCQEMIQSRTGLVIDAYFSATKIRWILDNVAGARAKAAAGRLAFGTVDSWLLWNLTGGRAHATDASNASRTLIYNINSGEWDADLLDLFGIPADILPRVGESSEVFGETAPGIFGAAIPVCGIAGDQQAALFGQACLSPGMVKNTYGTGCFMLMNTGAAAHFSLANLLTTVAWKIGGRTEYALEGSVFIAGAVVQWLRDGLGLIKSAREIEGLARSVKDNGGVYFVPAFAGLGAPHWDAYARGVIAGITRGTNAGHIARAALEAIAYQTADVLDAMRAEPGMPITELRADGGAAVNELLMQFQSDILGVPILRPRIVETTALGAAFLAGLAAGVWKSRDEIAGLWALERAFRPAMPPETAARLRARWRRAVERAKAWETPEAS